jgi:RNA polymerase sigma factor (sigma-70 family)
MTDDAARNEAFRGLFDAHHRAVLGYLARRTASAGNSDVEDLVEDVFLVAYRRIGEVLAAQSQRAWLLAVARKTAANHLRTSSRRLAILDRFRPQLCPPPDLADATAEAAAVHAALALLSVSDRELLELSAFDELTVAEIAEVLALTPATVSVRLHRARSRCRAAYSTVTAEHEERLEANPDAVKYEGKPAHG